jgi:hypothetical protein
VKPFLRAYLELIRFEFYVRRNNFRALRETVGECPVTEAAPSPDEIRQICQAIDLACSWYWKQVHCLQRSAATACLLKKRGAAAELVIGAQPMPFHSHAWVEIGGRVVNDKLSMTENYAVLDRC